MATFSPRIDTSRSKVVVLSAALLLAGRLCRAQAVVSTVSTPIAHAVLAVSQNAARYTVGQRVRLAVTISAGNTRLDGVLRVSATELGVPVYNRHPTRIDVPAGHSIVEDVGWTPPRRDFTAYLITAALITGARHLRASTAVDVSSTWTRYPRYGFISGYGRQMGDHAATIVRSLTGYHINSLQFYDWQFRHDEPVELVNGKPADEWHDIAGRHCYAATISSLIAAAHKRGIACMNYNLIYGGWANYATLGISPAWGLYRDREAQKQVSLPMPAGWSTPSIQLFNPANKGWQNWLLSQEQLVFKTYQFDGWQADQVGNMGPLFTANGAPVTLWKTFAPFLAYARGTLNKAVIFNNVGGYGLYDTAAHSHEAVVYVECWSPDQRTYQQLQQVINDAHVWSGGKAVVLAAYMDRAASNRLAAKKPGRFNPPGVLLTDAAIFASGATHIELGDNERLLGNEYFPNASLVAGKILLATLKRWYTFQTANETVLQSGAVVQPVRVVIKSHPTNGTARPGTIWTFGARGKEWSTVQLINLLTASTDAWRDNSQDCKTPMPTGPLHVRIYIHNQKVTAVYEGTPDSPTGALHRLRFKSGSSPVGRWITVTLPNLTYWDMLLLKGPHASTPG